MEEPLRWMKIQGPVRDRLKEAASIIESTEGNVRVISHNDGDGINSAAIISMAMKRAGKGFHTTMGPVIDEKALSALKEDFDLLIITDMGSSLASLISEKMMEMGKRAIILDHHKCQRTSPFSISDGRGIHEINPRFHGINGTTGCSGSTLSFLVSIAMDEANVDLCTFSLAGSIADRQHVPEFKELNKGIKELALEDGILTSFIGMPLHGASIEESLVMANDPFIKGISADPQRVHALLLKMGIDPEIKVEEVSREHLKVLQSYLYTYLLDNGIRSSTVNELFRETLVSAEFGNVESLAYDIDSCGRMREMGVGFQLIWGNKGARRKAHDNRLEYRKMIQKNLLEVEKSGINEMEHIQWLKVEKDVLAGTIASLSLNYLFDPTKPVLALSDVDDGIIKISGRGNHDLVRKGLDLGSMLDRACGSSGGNGGGHDVAAGGRIASEMMMSFLKEANEIVGGQMEGGSR